MTSTDTVHRVRLPSEAVLRNEERERRKTALDRIWRYIGTEVADDPTDSDLTVEVLQEALAELELTTSDIASRIARVRSARAMLQQVDSDAPADTAAIKQRQREVGAEIADLQAKIAVLEAEQSSLLVQSLTRNDNLRQHRSKAIRLRNQLLGEGMPRGLVPIPEEAHRVRVTGKVQAKRVFYNNVIFRMGDELQVFEDDIGESIVLPQDFVEPRSEHGAVLDAMSSRPVEEMTPEQVAELEAVAASNGQVERQQELKHPLSMAMFGIDMRSSLDKLLEQREALRGSMAATGLDESNPSVKHAKGLLDRLDSQIAKLEAGVIDNTDDGAGNCDVPAEPADPPAETDDATGEPKAD